MAGIIFYFFLLFYILFCELTIRTKYLLNLVDVHLLHVLTSWLQILTWVEVIP